MKRLAIIAAAGILALLPEPVLTSPQIVARPDVVVEYVVSAAPGHGPVVVLDLPYSGHEGLVRRGQIVEYPGMDKALRGVER